MDNCENCTTIKSKVDQLRLVIISYSRLIGEIDNLLTDARIEQFSDDGAGLTPVERLIILLRKEGYMEHGGFSGEIKNEGVH